MSVTAKEQSLAVASGRTVACATAGESVGTTVLLYLHRSFSGIHHIYPTLPGWGTTSAPFPLASIILYGAPYDKFPYGQRIMGVLLLAPVTPFFYHRDNAQDMNWSNYFMIGPLTRIACEAKHGAEKFIRGLIFDKMDAQERKEHARWRKEEGVEGETERRMATSWKGSKLMSTVLQSDWGFRPGALDEEHSSTCGNTWSGYLADAYKNTRLKIIHGGHIAVLYHLDGLWADFLAE
ncbi:hypothetical protein F5I97DRAFT_1935925 [Phlebopus sp. FC_14]|nr:hypothetical protein F5I97DRAFT_1935925 [Phlebopus sp. FC_14]